MDAIHTHDKKAAPAKKNFRSFLKQQKEVGAKIQTNDEIVIAAPSDHSMKDQWKAWNHKVDHKLCQVLNEQGRCRNQIEKTSRWKT